MIMVLLPESTVAIGEDNTAAPRELRSHGELRGGRRGAIALRRLASDDGGLRFANSPYVFRSPCTGCERNAGLISSGLGRPPIALRFIRAATLKQSAGWTKRRAAARAHVLLPLARMGTARFPLAPS